MFNRNKTDDQVIKSAYIKYKSELNKLSLNHGTTILHQALDVFNSRAGAGKVITSQTVGQSNVDKFLVQSDDIQNFMASAHDVINITLKPDNGPSFDKYIYETAYGGAKTQLLALIRDRYISNENIVIIDFPNINNLRTYDLAKTVFTYTLARLEIKRRHDYSKNVEEAIDELFTIFQELQDGFRQGERKRLALEYYNQLKEASNLNKRAYVDLGKLLNQVDIIDDDYAMEKIIKMMVIGSEQNLLYLILLDEIDFWFSNLTDDLSEKFIEKSQIIQILFQELGRAKVIMFLALTTHNHNLLRSRTLAEENAAISRINQSIANARRHTGKPYFGDTLFDAIGLFTALHTKSDNLSDPPDLFFSQLTTYFVPQYRNRTRRDTKAELLSLIKSYYDIQGLLEIGEKYTLTTAWTDFGNGLHQNFDSIMQYFGFHFIRKEVPIVHNNITNSKRLDGYFQYKELNIQTNTFENKEVLAEIKSGKEYQENKANQVILAARIKQEPIIQVYFGESSQTQIISKIRIEAQKTMDTPHVDYIKVVAVNNSFAFMPLIGYIISNESDPDKFTQVCKWLDHFSLIRTDLQTHIKAERRFIQEQTADDEERTQQPKIEYTLTERVLFIWYKYKHEWFSKKQLRISHIESFIDEMGTGEKSMALEISHDLRSLNLISGGGSKLWTITETLFSLFRENSDTFRDWIHSKHEILTSRALDSF